MKKGRSFFDIINSNCLLHPSSFILILYSQQIVCAIKLVKSVISMRS